jgi:hypothetical protein
MKIKTRNPEKNLQNVFYWSLKRQKNRQAPSWASQERKRKDRNYKYQKWEKGYHYIYHEQQRVDKAGLWTTLCSQFGNRDEMNWFLKRHIYQTHMWRIENVTIFIK